MRATYLISLSIALAAAMPAAAQVSHNQLANGNVFVTSGQTAVPVQIDASSNTVVNRVVEPVTPSFDSLIAAPVQYDENGVAKAQFFKASDLTPEQNRAFQDEVSRVRNYRAYNGISDAQPNYVENESVTYGVSDSVTYGSSNDSITYGASNDSITYGSNAPQTGVSNSYEIELYEQPQSYASDSYASDSYSSNVTVYNEAPVQSYASTSHTVSKGDTLYNIAKRYDVSIGELQDENGMSGTLLSLGQALRIPSNITPASTLPTLSTLNQPTLAQPIFASAPVRDGAVTRRIVQPIPASSRPLSSYAVLKKDTLYSIAKRSCVSVTDLAVQNGITDPGSLQTGQQLTLPLGHCLTK